MPVRGIRGATTAEKNTEEGILSATTQLLKTMLQMNEGLKCEDISCVTFSATNDLDAVYPAKAARELGWKYVPLFCTQEMMVEETLDRCIRVLILWNTNRSQQEIRHIYSGRAQSLRPDLSGAQSKEDPGDKNVLEGTRS
jgi:chorismate mutase